MEIAALAVLGLVGGGCSYRMGSLFGGTEADHTASIAPPPLQAAVDTSDLTLAKKAAVEVLNRQDKNASLPWENPATGARGTVTPLANAYSQDGQTCRDFLASHVRDGKESWLQGGACREGQGQWEVRELRPWKRS